MNHQESTYFAVDKKLLSPDQAKGVVQDKNAQSLPRDQLEKRSSSPTDQKATSRISRQENNRDTTTPRNHDTTVSHSEEDTLDKVRRAVRQLGKEAATHRFTQEEKNLIAEVVYTYRKKGIRTSENEIARISINYLLMDYRAKGASSILARILEKLNT